VRGPAWIASFLLVFGAASLASAQTRLPNRITRRADDRQMSVVHGSRSALARSEFDRGRIAAGRALGRMALVFKPSAAQAADLEALLAAQQDPQSPEFHHWITPDEYAARFGMSDADLAEVSDWLRSHGLVVHGAGPSRTELSFSGTAAQVENAFRTEVHEYLVNGELHRANATDPSIPSAYADVVLAIRRLSDFRPRPRLRRPTGRFTSSISGNHYLAPGDVATIYGLKPLYAAGFDGTGQKIAVIGQSALAAGGATTDIDAFRAAGGLPPTLLQQVLVPGSGAPIVCAGDVGEADLDVEWSGAIAPNATIVYVYTGVSSGRTCATTPYSVWDSLHYAVSHALAPVISMSYGACEAANGLAFAQVVRGWAQQANAQGQTIVAASGDSGAADCDDPSSPAAAFGLAVDVPAAIPEVTGAGGTELDDSSDPSLYWSPTNDADAGSALQYIPELSWNDSAISSGGGFGIASGGGGASAFFAKPSWQTGTGVPADGRRDVPDVSLTSSAQNDGYLICSQGSCVNGFRAADLSLNVIGGTSAAAPGLAGIFAIISGGTGASGLGNANPRLYALAASAPGAFHDVTSGSNVVPCLRGSTNCPASAPFQLGYLATAGYDRATGLGSVDAATLASEWVAKIATTTSLAVSNATPAVGSTVTFTATVTPTAAGFGSPAGGAVQFTVDDSAVGAPVTVAKAGGVYRASYSASSLPGGAHAIGASYGGNLAVLASNAAPVPVTVSDFSITANPASVTVAVGGSATSTLTVTASDGFAGTVSLACAPSSTMAEIGCAIQPATVTLSSAAPTGTATLTITTTLPHALGATGALLGGELLVAMALLVLPLRRRSHPALGVALLLLATSSCGGGGGGGGGGSAASAAVSAPAAPENLTATAGDRRVMLAWTETGRVTHFGVGRATASRGPFTEIATPSTTSYTDTGLVGGTTYYYVVDAVNGAGKSAATGPVAATPGNPGTPASSYSIGVTATSGAASHSTDVALMVN
jgi:subtilase family serine protease